MKCGSVALSMCIILPRSSTTCRSGIILTPSIIVQPLCAVYPPQRVVQPAGVQQVAQPLQTREPLVNKLIVRQFDCPERFIYFLRAFLRSPFELKLREDACEFGEISSIRALVRPRLRPYLQPAVGNGPDGYFSQLKNLMV